MASGASPHDSLVGRELGHYLIVEKIGSGGMGVVYRANDKHLLRDVAIKVLPSHALSEKSARKRFQQEALALSKLNHANIGTIIDFDSEPDVDYLVMEYIPGTTLAQRLAHGPQPEKDVLNLGIQVASALEEAHEHGVIHRDLKPANIMITPKGTAKVLDFGLAKTIEAAGDTTVSVTERHAIVGTYPYISPEQLRGERIDARSDIYSLGVVLYEMATGRCPFVDRVPAALIDAILNRLPTSPCSLNPAVSPGLERVIVKALDKDPGCRYQSAREIHVDLQRLRRDAETGSTDRSSRETATLAATPKLGRWAFTLTAILALAFAVGVLLLHRSRAHALSPTDTVILADFANSTGNAVFDDALKQALTVSLRQSPFLNVLSDEKIGATLRLMTRPTNTPLTPEIAREVCQRAGSKAFIAGSIANLGSEFVLGLKALSCQTGDTLAIEQMEAAKREEVLDVLGSAAAKLRTELGESLSSVQRFGTPIAQATTPSFEGLKAYSLGIKNWNENGEAQAIPFFRQAIELDPNFAMAYAYLGVMYGVIGEQSRSVENLTKAFQLRDRVTEAEKFFISSSYYLVATGELEKSIQVSDMWAQAYPRDPNPHLSAGGSQALLGQYENAVAETRKCLDLDPDHAVCGANLIQFYTLLNRLPEARSTYEETLKRNPEFAALHAYQYGLAFLQGNTAAMEKEVKWAADKPGWGDVLLSYQSDSAAFFGHLREARELSARAVDSAQRNGQKETAILWKMNAALREAEFGNSTRAYEASTSALKMASTRGLQVLVALALARAGDSRRAEHVADELERQFPLDTIINSYWLPVLRASIEINRHNPSRALEFAKAATPYELGLASNLEFGALLYPAYVRGQAFLMLHQGSEAAAEFQKFLEHRALVANSPLSALARVGLARAYTLADDKERARLAYQDFLTLWKDCDPEIPVVQEARAELAKLKSR